MSSPKQLARIGIFYLEEAVLDVLYNESELRPGQISERAGIPSTTNLEPAVYAIVRGILSKLQNEGRVEDIDPPHPKWRLTAEEREKRTDEIINGNSD